MSLFAAEMVAAPAKDKAAKKLTPVACAVKFKKTAVCCYYPKCAKGDQCYYAHSESELRTRPNFTKTRMCAGYRDGRCKLPASECGFAHGRHDLRPVGEPAAARKKASPAPVMPDALESPMYVSVESLLAPPPLPPRAPPGVATSCAAGPGTESLSGDGALTPTASGASTPASLAKGLRSGSTTPPTVWPWPCFVPLAESTCAEPFAEWAVGSQDGIAAQGGEPLVLTRMRV